MGSTSIICNKNTWKKVVTNSKQGRIRVTLTNPTQYFYDVVDAGAIAPSLGLTTGSKVLPYVWNFQFRENVDIYIYAFTFDGRVDVDNDAPYTSVTITDTNGNDIGIDVVTRSLITIDYSHHEIHSGSHYYTQGFLELDDTDTFFIKMVTPDTTKWSHFIFAVSSTGICTTYLDEGASGGMAGGSSVLPLNNNRNSSNTSGMFFTSGVTNATAFVTRLESDKWGTAGFKENIGGGGGREDEILLKQNTTYLRTFISGANDNIIQFKASWYEHTSKT